VNRLALIFAAGLVTAGLAFAQEGDGIPADTDIQTTKSGLKYSVLKAAEGATPKAGDSVRVHYTGWTTDGKKFDSSRDRGTPFKFVLGQGQVIKGWDEGVALMTKGSRYKFSIPYQLAYGENGRPPRIPAKAELIFDVELIDFFGAPTMPTIDPETSQKTESGMLWKKTKGSGAKLGANGFGKINFAFWSSKTKKLVQATDTDPRETRISGSGASQRLDFLKEFWALAEIGATYELQVPAKLAFGEQGIPGRVGPGEDTIWRLTVEEGIPFARDAKNVVKKTESGIEYEIIKEGEGKQPTAASRVKVDYIGWLKDGTVFDSSLSRGQPATFGLNQVIAGWTEGMQLMKPGGIYRFTIPWKLAYGEAGRQPMIPAKADLIFWVELKEVL
jgi:FKBP-type peptidyl-prolyl cis-trans isomerase